MRRLRIAVDVDDVLAENAAGIVAFSNQRWGTNLTVDDYDEHWAKMWQVDNAEVKRRSAELMDAGLGTGYGHIGGALEVLERSLDDCDITSLASEKRYNGLDRRAFSGYLRQYIGLLLGHLG